MKYRQTGQPAVRELLNSCKQAQKPFVLGSKTFFRTGNLCSAAYF